MKPTLTATLFLLLSSTLFAQHDNNPCGTIGYTQVGAIAQPLNTFGFHASRHQPVNQSSLYVGAGVEALRMGYHQWAVPVQAHLTYIALPFSPSPVLQLSPGYILNPSEFVQGLTLYVGLGVVYLNGLFTLGYSQIGKESGIAAKLCVML